MFKRPKQRAGGRQYRRSSDGGSRSGADGASIPDLDVELQLARDAVDDTGLSEKKARRYSPIGFMALQEDCTAKIMSFLPVRGVLKFSEASRRAHALTCHDAVWEHLRVLRQQVHSAAVPRRSKPDTEASFGAQSPADVGDKAQQQQRCAARARCVPLRRRCEELEAAHAAAARSAARAAAQRTKAAAAAARIGRDVAAALRLPHGAPLHAALPRARLPRTVRAWPDLADPARCSDDDVGRLRAALAPRCMALADALADALEGGRGAARELGGGGSGALIGEGLRSVGELCARAERRHSHHLGVTAALTRWLARFDAAAA
ncbi:hypothetical protein JKP88DRAFT_262878 [Tribonema minus]|uniref:F-box domain-containing protein n=1 Tax=Tribonema minus TaxID=303371 RepID=A0A835Z2H8_9STRA|nr:hypothetical protein JKP88DRAFT_262878 [Tribonema minus]